MASAVNVCFRDLHTADQHIYVGAEAWKRYAKIALGIDGPSSRSSSLRSVGRPVPSILR
jgi:hypothetical protein